MFGDEEGYPSQRSYHEGGRQETFDREPLPVAQGLTPRRHEGLVSSASDVQDIDGIEQATAYYGISDEADLNEKPDSAAATSSYEGFSTDGNDEQILISAAVQEASEAAQFEHAAMEADRSSDYKEAISNYLLAAEKLKQAASLCPDGLADKAVLSRHAGEVLGRVVYLESLGGAPATAPVEKHIGTVTLSLGAPPEEPEDAEAQALGFETLSDSDCVMLTDEAEGRPQGLKKRAASAAAVVGGTGLLVLHAPLFAVGMAGATAYAATRQDTAGRAARKVGDVGIKTATKASTMAEEYRISERMNLAVGKVVNERQMEKAASTVESLRDFNRKHQVTKTLGHGASAAASGVVSATSSLSNWMSSAVRKTTA